ncbi:hypothetical protein B9G55_01575 [Saccharibacillus sp. O16]|nr:hypothetical protein B9G55_01575 [Saccharibacillus sp. O16]
MYSSENRLIVEDVTVEGGRRAFRARGVDPVTNKKFDGIVYMDEGFSRSDLFKKGNGTRVSPLCEQWINVVVQREYTAGNSRL